jgi:hypothetical protein
MLRTVPFATSSDKDPQDNYTHLPDTSHLLFLYPGHTPSRSHSSSPSHPFNRSAPYHLHHTSCTCHRQICHHTTVKKYNGKLCKTATGPGAMPAIHLVDGIIYSFQEQTTEDQVMLDGFGTIVNALGINVKPYLTQIVSTILWWLNNKSTKVRQQAVDLTTRLAVVIKHAARITC